MQAAHIIAGLILLFLGRQLFWVFVAVLGFVVGMDLATQFLPDAGQLALLVIAIAAGVLGALVALFFYQVGIAVAGFLAGGRIGLALLAMVNASPQLGWLVFLIAGVLGALLLLLVFDWALIVISALLGASLVVESCGFSAGASGLLLLGLTAVGVAVQAQMLRARSPAP